MPRIVTNRTVNFDNFKVPSKEFLTIFNLIIQSRSHQKIQILQIYNFNSKSNKTQIPKPIENHKKSKIEK